MDIGEFSEKSNKFCKVGGGGRITYPGLASHGGGGCSCTPSYFMLLKPG